MPRAFWDWKLLQCAIRLVSAGLRASAGDARFDECDHVLAHLRPEVVTMEEFQGFRLTRVTREWMIVTGFKYAGPQDSVVWNEHDPLVKEEACGRKGPPAICVRCLADGFKV